LRPPAKHDVAITRTVASHRMRRVAREAIEARIVQHTMARQRPVGYRDARTGAPGPARSVAEGRDVSGSAEASGPARTRDWRYPGVRATWNAAKLWATGMSSMLLTFTCAGSADAHATASATSSAVSGCMPV
jgi:hypothetical protein